MSREVLQGVLLIGDPNEIVEKIRWHNDAVGGF